MTLSVERDVKQQINLNLYAFLVLFYFYYTVHYIMDMDTRYNLRSQRRTEKVIPVELQMTSDADFFSQTVEASHPMPGQVYSDHSLSTSASDLDISGLLDTSDRDFHSPVLDPESLPGLVFPPRNQLQAHLKMK